MPSHEEKEGAKFLPLLRKFEEEWFPSQDVPKNIDFIIWLEKKGYGIVPAKDVSEGVLDLITKRLKENGEVTLKSGETK